MKKQHLTESEIMRKYSNIVAEAQESVQLNEGMMDTLKQYAAKLMKVLDPATLKQIATTVKQATGGDYSLTKANAQKVAQALGAQEQGQMSEERAPALAISPTLGGKIAQALHLGAIGAAGASAAGLIGTFGGLPIVIGFLALMFTEVFWGTGAGQLGSEYDVSGNPLGRQEIKPKKGVVPKHDNPGFDRGGSNIT